MTDADDTTIGRLLVGVLRSVKALLDFHLETAKREATTDLGRVGISLVLFAVAFCTFIFCLLFLHFAGVKALEVAYELPRWTALLIVGLCDFVIAVVLVVVGRLRLRRPLLCKTRRLIRKTVNALSNV